MKPTPATCTGAVPAWARRRSGAHWYDQYALNEQATAFAAYDPDRITRELLGTGAEIITVYAANQFGVAYYPSALWPQHPGLQGRDYVGDLVTRLRAHGKWIVLYVNWLDSKHPEWQPVRLGQSVAEAQRAQPLASWADPGAAHGRVQALAGGQWQLPCLNSPQREQIAALTREIVQRYAPDAFQLDMFLDAQVCVCPYCRPTVERICGTTELTQEAIVAHWPQYIDWRCGVSASLLAELAAILREHGVLSAQNAFTPLFMPPLAGLDESWLPSLDVYVSESFEAFLSSGGDLNATSANLRLLHALGKPPWILRLVSSFHFGHWPLPPAQLQIQAAACRANGGAAFGPCGMAAHPDTTSSQALLEATGQVLDFYMRDADLAEEAESAARIALVFSWATRRYERPPAGGSPWKQEWLGWARLLMEEHLPFDALVAESLPQAEALRRYDLLILPDLIHLSEAACRLLREYVRQGGRVLATGGTSQGDERGSLHGDLALGDLFGVTLEGREEASFYLSGHREPEPVYGPLHLVSAQGQVLAGVVAADPAGAVSGAQDPMPRGATGRPAAVLHDYGAGQSLYAAFTPGRSYDQHGDPHLATWMTEFVDRLLPQRQITVRAPRTVEVTLWRQPQRRRTILHLANRSVPWSLPTEQRQITEILPVHDVEVALPTPCVEPCVQGRGVEVESRREGERLLVRIPALGAYAAVVIEPTCGAEKAAEH